MNKITILIVIIALLLILGITLYYVLMPKEGFELLTDDITVEEVKVDKSTVENVNNIEAAPSGGGMFGETFNPNKYVISEYSPDQVHLQARLPSFNDPDAYFMEEDMPGMIGDVNRYSERIEGSDLAKAHREVEIDTLYKKLELIKSRGGNSSDKANFI